MPNLQQLIADLKVAEGIRKVAYDDANGEDIRPGSVVVGHPTIGAGHRIDLPLSDSIIDALLASDIQDAVYGLDRGLPWWRDLPEPQQRVLCELAFWIGPTGLLRFHRMLAALKDGMGNDAADELADSRLMKDFPKRCTRLATALRTPLLQADTVKSADDEPPAQA